MVRKLIWAFGVLPITVIVIAFALANRHAVNVFLDPTAVSDATVFIQTPLFLLIFAALAAGLLLGGLATWLRQGKWRKQARDLSGEAARWRREVDRLSAELEQAGQARLPQPSNND